MTGSEDIHDTGATHELLDPHSVAGSSARREHERRKKAREGRIRRQHPKLGGLILALSQEPQSTRAWAVGAHGEEQLGRRLDMWAGPLVRVLHDRRIPGTRANLDHIVICPGGVLVIDTKRYQGRPRLRTEGGVLSPRTERLLVGTRDRTRLVDGALRQADIVRKAVADADIDVASVLCFVGADWPLLGGDFHIRNAYVTWPKKLASRINRPGPLVETEVCTLHRQLAQWFPAA